MLNLKEANKKIRELVGNTVAIREGMFIALFYSLYLVYKIFHNVSFALDSFPARSVSVATAEGIDIGKRISAFYQGTGLLILLTVFFLLLIHRMRKWVATEDLRIMNSTAFTGSFLLFFQLLGANLIPVLHLLLIVQLVCMTGIAGKNFYRIKMDENNYITFFTWILTLSFCLFFLQAGIAGGFGMKSFLHMAAFTGLCSTFLLLISLKLLSGDNEQVKQFEKWIFLSQPAAWLPLLLFLASEFYMILNQRGIFSFSPFGIYLVSFAVLALFVYMRIRRMNNLPRLESGQAEKLLYLNWFPTIIAGIICFAQYKPTVSPEIDWFEDANHILPLQQFHDFGKIPFIHTFSSHAASDFAWGFIYSFLNGYNIFGAYVYYFLMMAIIALVIYYFVYKITGNGIFALFLAVFYPYTELILPGYYNLVPLTVLALLNIYRKQTARNYFFFLLVVLFMILWRIDLGFANLVAGAAGLALLVFAVPGFQADKKLLLKGFSVFFFSLMAVAIILLLKYGSLLVHHFQDALGYVSSFQSYGTRDLSYAHDMKYYSLYFVLPLAVLLVAAYALIRLIKSEPGEKQTTILSLTILFLSVFFFANFQRGLVRHSLAEGWDTAFTSYGFFILSSTVFYIRKNSFSEKGMISFLLLSALIVINYKIKTPDLTWSDHYTWLADRLEKPAFPANTSERVERVLLNPLSRRNNFGELDDFMNKNFPPGSTFLDFSNTPMLYGFLHRTIPNYFCQIPHTAHNEYMQKRFLEELKDYQIPVVVFSNVPQTFWDGLDGISNTFRQYRIAEYIYRNYRPYAVMNNHTVWILKNLQLPPPDSKLVFGINNLVNVPLHNAVLSDSITVRTGSEQPQFKNLLSHPVSLDPEKKYFIQMNGWSDRPGTFTVIQGYGTGEEQKTALKTFGGELSLFAIVQPPHDIKELKSIRMELPPGSEISFTSIRVISSDHIPDNISTKAVENILKYIPFIWGQFDESYRKGTILPEASLIKPIQTIEADHLFSIGLPEIKEKENGNYLHIRARVPGDKPVDVIVRYGLNNETQGSFIFTLKDSASDLDYLVRVSAQYNWMNKEHNWLSIYPEGGKISLSAADILKGD